MAESGGGDVLESPPVATTGAVGGENSSHVGSVVLGWRGGRAMEFSKETGQAIPPSHVTKKGLVVADYYDGSELGETSYITFASTDSDGNPVYLGPNFKDRHGNRSFNKWWPRDSDWMHGLSLIIYAQNDPTDTSGAAGQWTHCLGRAYNKQLTVELEFPFATAPVAGDVCAIGAQPFWCVWPNQTAAPMGNTVVLHQGKIIVRRISGTVSPRVEVYRSGQTFELSDPAFPFKPGGVYSELTPAEARQPVVYNFGVRDRDGNGVTGYEFSVAVAAIVQGEEFALIETAYVAEELDRWVQK